MKLDISRREVTPKSWKEGTHQGLLHLGRRWYVVSATLGAAGIVSRVWLDGPYTSRKAAEAVKSRLSEHWALATGPPHPVGSQGKPALNGCS